MVKYSKNLFFLFFSFYISYCICEIFEKSFVYKLILSILIMGIISALYGAFPIVKITKRQKIHTRQSGADIVRTIAVLFVPLIHFFGLSGYYNAELSQKYFMPTCIRWLALTAVPIFMILTGYFKSKKKISFDHYKAIIPVLLTHIFISSIRVFVDYKYHSIEVTRDYIFSKLLYFEYGWYVKLYIGMMLFIPFFNVVYNNLKTRQHKEIFILTLSAVNFLPSLTAYIVPSSWLILYVFAYYIIGAYLSEYKIKINKAVNFILIVFLLAITSFATIKHCSGDVFDWNFIGLASNSGYSSFPAFALSVLIVIFFIDIKLPKIPSRFFEAVSLVSLEMYLFSQMFDGFVYPHFIDKGWDFDMFMSNIIIVVGSVAVLAFICSYIKKVIFVLPILAIAGVYYLFEKYAEKPKNEHNTKNPQDKPKNEHNTKNPQDKPKTEHNTKNTQDKPKTEHNIKNPQDKPKNEHNTKNPQDKPKNEHNTKNPQDKPKTEHNTKNPQDKPKNEHNTKNPQDKPKNEHNTKNAKKQTRTQRTKGKKRYDKKENKNNLRSSISDSNRYFDELAENNKERNSH